MLYCAKFNEVPREVFNEVSDWMTVNDNTWIHISISYHGTNSKGDVTIEELAGYSKEYFEALKYFVERYCQ